MVEICLLRMNHKEMENLNRPINSEEIERTIKNLLKTGPGLDVFTTSSEFFQSFKEDLRKRLDAFKRKRTTVYMNISLLSTYWKPHTKNRTLRQIT